jgi:Hemerythrin HHE cation binding domain
MEAKMGNDSQAVRTRTDFYTVVHKALRKRLFEAVVLAGTTDYADAEDRARLTHVVAEIVTTLREHAEHEEEFLHPIIADVLPEAARSLHAEHEAHHRALDEVERAFELAIAERTAEACHGAYRTFARFTAAFLTHIEEEEAGQPRLWELAGEDRLAAGMTAFKHSRTLEQSLTGWANMLPAMNPAERTGLFRALKGGAPGPVVSAALRLAEQVLDERAWQTLKSSLETTRVASFRAA